MKTIVKNSSKKVGTINKPFIAPELNANEIEKNEILNVKQTSVPISFKPFERFERAKPIESKKREKTGISVIDTIESLISFGKYTRKQIIPLVANVHPNLTLSTITTILTDCKNPKYNRLFSLVKCDENGNMYFVDGAKTIEPVILETV